MKIKKYRATDSQQAMRQIKAELGPDASILTCYQVPEGVEIVVALDTPDLVDVDAPAAARLPAARQKVDVTPTVASEDRDMLTLRQELGSMRTLLERHLHKLAVREPQPLVVDNMPLVTRLGESGFSGSLQQRLRTLMPAQAGGAELREALRASLADVSCAPLPMQGVTALIGTPGAGKTQLLATLALQHVLAQTSQPLYLVSTDSQRFGAREQLLALGRVLRLPVLFAADTETLRAELAQLPGDARVLLDTAGADHGDSEALAALAGLLDDVSVSQRLLVLPLDMAASAQERTLAAYAGLTPSGVVTTRVDTLAAPGELASWLCQSGLSWHGASAGRDPATAWQPADVDALAERIAATWPEVEPEVTEPVVSRWSWTAQRISA